MKEVKKESRMFPLKLIVIVFAISSLQMSAKTPGEFSIYGGGGFSTFHFQQALNKASSGGFSGEIGVGFTGFVSPQVGFHIGAGFNMYNTNIKVDSLGIITPNLISDDKYTAILHTAWFDYSETHNTFCLTIPLMIHFQSNMDHSWNMRQSVDKGFYAMTGIKANLMLSRKYDAKFGSFYNFADFTDMENGGGTQQFAGIGTFPGKKNNGKLNFGILAMFALEMGIKWRLNDNMFLYTGAYFDYGLVDPSKSSREPVSNYATHSDDLEDFALSLVSKEPPLEFADKMNLMTVGVKLRLAFIRYSSAADCPRGF